jgi:hypothetical protein
MLTDVSEEFTASIIGARFSETSVSICQITRCNVQEDSQLQIGDAFEIIVALSIH